MKATIITLYRAELAETYVGLVRGELSSDQRQLIMDRCDLSCDSNGIQDAVGFVEMELVEDPDQLALKNAFPSE